MGFVTLNQYETSTDGVWSWTTRRGTLDAGLTPKAMPPDSFIVVSGVDGRYEGGFRRYLGHELAHQFAFGSNTDGYPADGDGLRDIVPFHMVKDQGPHSIQGFVCRVRITLGLDRQPLATPLMKLIFLWRDSSVSTDPTIGWTHTVLDSPITAIEGVGTPDVAVPDFTTAPRMSATSWGPYLYLYTEDGSFKWTVYRENDTWTFSKQTKKIPKKGFLKNKQTSGGLALKGRVQLTVQFYDENRLRRSNFMNPASVSWNSENGYIGLVMDYTGDTARLQEIYDSGWTHYEIYATISTQDTAIAPGGYFRYMDTFEITDEIFSNDGLPVNFEAYKDADRTESSDGVDVTNITDLSLLTLRFVDPVLDAPDAVPDTWETHDYKGVTFVVTQEEGRAVLRHGITHRLEKESFPEFNAIRTGVEMSSPFAFVEAGDFLYFFGDGPYWRMRIRPDTFVEALKMGEHLSLAGRWAICSVDRKIYIVTRKGFFIVDATTGSDTRVRSLDRIIRDRWADTLSSVQLAYDEALDCVYVHNSELEESVTLWGATNAVRMLSSMHSEVRQLHLGNEDRAVFLTKRKHNEGGQSLYVTKPYKKTSTQTWQGPKSTPVTLPLTMTGWTDTDQDYNPAIFDASNFQDEAGVDRCQIVIPWQDPTSQAVTKVGYYVWAQRVNDCCVYPYYVYDIDVDPINSRILLKCLYPGEATAPFSEWLPLIGGAAHLDPIPMEVIASSMHVPMDPEHHLRRRKATHLSVDGSQWDLDTAPLTSTESILECAVLSPEQVLGESAKTEPATWVFPDQMTGVAPGKTPGTDDPTAFVAYLNEAGFNLFPYVRCVQANMDFELNEITIRGIINKPGHGTGLC